MTATAPSTGGVGRRVGWRWSQPWFQCQYPPGPSPRSLSGPVHPVAVLRRSRCLRPREFLGVAEKAVYKVKCQTARAAYRRAASYISSSSSDNYIIITNNNSNDYQIMNDYISPFADGESESFEDFNDISGDKDDFYIYNDNNTGVPAAAVAAELHTQLVPAILMFICTLGLVGNGMVVYVIVHYVTIRKVTYLYLMNLAVVNILYLLASAPITAIHYALTDWPFGPFVCKLNGYISSICLSVSVLTLTATGFDRYLAVLHPVQSRSFRTEKKALGVIAIIWFTSLVLMAPRMLLYEVFDMFHVHDTRTFCSTLVAGKVARRVDSGLMFLGTYLLPQIALAFCHLRIGLHLWRGRRPGVATSHHHDDGGGGGGSVLGLTERRKIAKIVFAITLAFCIGWLPMHIITLYEDFSAEGDRIAFTDRAALVFGFSFGANAINPIIYCLLSRHFRMYFKCALTCRSPTDVTRTSAPAARTRIFHRHEAPRAAATDVDDVVREERTDRDEEIIAVEDRNAFAVSSRERHWKSPSSCGAHHCTPGRQRIVLHVAPLTLTSSVSLDSSDSDMLKVHLPGNGDKTHRQGIGQNTNDPCSSIPHIV